MIATAAEFGLAGLYQYIGYDIGTEIEKSPIPTWLSRTGQPMMETRALCASDFRRDGTVSSGVAFSISAKAARKGKTKTVHAVLCSEYENLLDIRDVLSIDNATNAQTGCIDQAWIP